MRLVKRFLPALIVGVLSAGRLCAQPFAVGGDPSVNPADFRVTTFASGLNSPYGMQQLSDNSIIVATSDGPDFFSSTGRLLRFVDANQDGVADGPGQVLASGLAGSMTAVEQSGNLIFAISNTGDTPRINVLRKGATPSSSLTSAGSINFTFQANTWHTVHALATRPTPGVPGSSDLFFNVGSAENYPATSPSRTASASGLMSGTLNPDSLYKVSFQDTGSSVTFSNLTQLAAGLRNAAGITVHPTTGDLYFQDNGIDGLSDGNEPLSADELNRITAANIGQSIPHFGFSSGYVEYRTGNVVGGGVQPLVAFQPIPNPNNGSESEGAAQIAISPSTFPAAVNNGVFVGFHGKFFSGGITNEENPLVYYDLETGQYFHFISNDEPNISHPNGVLAAGDSLFVSDMGSFLTSNPNGAIYQIKSLVPLLGNLNGDHAVNNFDIQPFELALTNPSGYMALYNQRDYAKRGDLNGDGVFNNFDIQPFENFLTGQSAPVAAVPEPGTLILLLLGACILLAIRGSSDVKLRHARPRYARANMAPEV